MKKTLGILSLAALMLVGCASTPSNVNTGFNELAEDKLATLDGRAFVKGAQLGGDETLASSETYVQYGVDVNNRYVIRFATAVKGNIDSLTYTRAAVEGREEKVVEVTTVYQSIMAEGQAWYYDGTELTTDESAAGNYYWACYSIGFEEGSSYYNVEFDVSLAINNETVASNTSSLKDICDDCSVVGHNFVKEGTLKSTSVTTGYKLQICDKCDQTIKTDFVVDETNSGVLASSGVDKAVNNVDIVRGLYGDAVVKFSFRNEMIEKVANSSVGRVYFIVDDKAKFDGDDAKSYTYAVPWPILQSSPSTTDGSNSTGYNGADNYLYRGNSYFTTQYDTWFKGAFTDHAKDMNVDVTIKRIGELVHVNLIGHCNDSSHIDCHNQNDTVFYLSEEKGLNVVLGTTYANITLLNASLSIGTQKNEQLPNSILVSPNAEAWSETTEQVVYTHHFDDSLNHQTVKFKFHESNSIYDHDSDGYWNAYLWRTDKTDESGNMLVPYPYSTNSGNKTILGRITPVRDHYTQWNGMASKNWSLEGGVTGTMTKGMSLDPVNPDGSNASISFRELLLDCDVEITMTKIGRHFALKVRYENSDGVYATRYFASLLPKNVSSAFTLVERASTINLNSVVVETFA